MNAAEQSEGKKMLVEGDVGMSTQTLTGLKRYFVVREWRDESCITGKPRSVCVCINVSLQQEFAGRECCRTGEERARSDDMVDRQVGLHRLMRKPQGLVHTKYNEYTLG